MNKFRCGIFRRDILHRSITHRSYKGTRYFSHIQTFEILHLASPKVFHVEKIVVKKHFLLSINKNNSSRLSLIIISSL